MFSERLERLIDAALQDGMLSDQEKAAIIKRAQAEGEDIDEVDIYIQSLQQKRQQELNEQAQKAQTEEMVAQKKAREAASKARLEEEKERAKLLRKCPACGEPIPFGTITCPKCGIVVDLDDKNKEILEFIKVIKRAAPTGVGSGEFTYNRIFDKDTFNNDPIFQRAYTIKGTNSWNEEEYEVKSNYEELIAEAKIKYFGSPIFKKFLLEERKRIFNKLLDNVEVNLNKAKKDIALGTYWDYRTNEAMQNLNKIEFEYADIADMDMISIKKDAILELEAKGIKIQQEQERKRQEQERKLSYKVSNFFTCIDEKVWVAIFSIVVLILIAFILK